MQKLAVRLLALAAIVLPTAITAETMFLPSVRQHQPKGHAASTGVLAMIDAMLGVHALVIPGLAMLAGFVLMAIVERMLPLLLCGVLGGAAASGLLVFVTQKHKQRALAIEAHMKKE